MNKFWNKLIGIRNVRQSGPAPPFKLNTDSNRSQADICNAKDDLNYPNFMLYNSLIIRYSKYPILRD